MQLNRTPNALTRTDRDNLNKNWSLIEEAINEIGPAAVLAELAKRAADNVQSQVNTLVINGDSSPAAAQAAVDARGIDKGNLKKRIDDDYNEISLSLTEKADKTDLQGLSQAFKESYDTVALLQAAYPSGDTYNHTVKSDGLIYTWNQLGTWVSTGIQANGTGVADGTLTLKKLAFTPVIGEKSKNLFNKSTITSGKYVNATHGNLSDGATYFASDFIAIEPSTEYSRTSKNQMAFYDVNKVFISGLGNTAPNNITTPANARYIRVTGLLSELATFQVEKGAVVTAYASFDAIRVSKNTLLSGEVLEKNTVSPEKLTFKPLVPSAVSANIFNKETVTDGRYVSSTSGSLNSNSVFSATDFIPVVASTEYVFSERGQMAWFDANKIYISGNAFGGGSSTLGTGVVTSPVGAAYLRTSLMTANKNIFQVKKGTDLGTYENFGEAYISKIQIEPSFYKQVYNPLYGLKWNVIGDSITDGFGFKPYHSFIAERSGIMVRNYGISGTTIANNEAGTATTAMCMRYKDMDNDADIITVFGGTNDFGGGRAIGTLNDGTNNTFYGGVQTLIEGLLVKYPTKRIGFILPIQRKYVTVPVAHLSVYVDILKEVCKYYSIPYLDLYSAGGINPNIEASRLATVPDFTHPNDAGHKILSYKIEEFIRGV